MKRPILMEAFASFSHHNYRLWFTGQAASLVGTWMQLTTQVLGQLHVPDQLRGRVMSVYTLAFMGMFPLSALLSGTVAEMIGEPTTVAFGALITITFGGALWVYAPQLRALK